MIPLFKPHMPPLPAMDDVLHGGMLAYGEFVARFEAQLAQYFSSNVIAVNSFSNAIWVTLAALGLHAGDTVIASPMACLASTQPLVAYGLRVVFADVDPDRGTLCPDDVRRRITAHVKGIIHNHFCGYPGYIDEINAIGSENGIPVIDDCIEAFGSEYRGNKLGCCGGAAAYFALSPVRIPNTVEGGAVAFKDKMAYERSLLLRDHGIDRKRFRDDLGEIDPDYDINYIGYDAMMSNVNGYIGSVQMEHVPKLLQAQRAQALCWNAELSEAEYKPIKTTACLPNYWVYGILAQNKRSCIEHFRKRGFYASGVHVDNSAYSIFAPQSHLPGVKEFYSRFVALPCGWWMEERK